MNARIEREAARMRLEELNILIAENCKKPYTVAELDARRVALENRRRWRYHPSERLKGLNAIRRETYLRETGRL